MENKPVLAFLQIDNLSEVIKNMAEEDKPHLLAALERSLGEWAGNLEGYLNRIGEGRYILFFTEWGYKQVEKTRFSILEKIRGVDVGNEKALTMSLGIAINEDNISELGKMAQQALEIALDRGGDQVVVKTPENLKFYGGKAVNSERRTKIKARVTADALKEMISEAAQVMVIGHIMADFDSLGAAFGIARAAKDLGKRSWVVLDEDNPAVHRILTIYSQEDFAGKIVKAREAGNKMVENTLLVVVDTHKPSLLPNQKLLKQAFRVAVIDHHRRGEEFINEGRLVYLETNASSASELVTELVQYYAEQVELSKAEAALLLAGITVDTKGFMQQTGVRTFEAAAYLRSIGADPAAIHKILSDDIYTVMKKAEVISKLKILYGKIALGVYPEKTHDAQLMAAKTADAILNIVNIEASFVVWPYHQGVAVSARSNGEINVQLIMEELGGGGHHTVAAAQLNEDLVEVEKRLLQKIETHFYALKQGKTRECKKDVREGTL